MQITDSPRFAWRGVLLDVGRHYFSVPFHKKFLDAMAFHKMNKFHWHLTEDQVHHLSCLPLVFLAHCWHQSALLTRLPAASGARHAQTQTLGFGTCMHALSLCLHVVQGWRLQVKSYPNLTEHGAWRGREGSTYGGFFSQDEVC